MRNYLINLSYYCQGDYRLMEKHLLNESLIPSPIKTHTKLVTILDQAYPQSLLSLESPPLVLYYEGNLRLINKPSVGVIGSRKPSNYALEMTEKLVHSIGLGLVIVSGMAYGIDSAAHKAALNYNTIAVLGNGLDCVYPYANKELQGYLMKEHLVISEYPPGRGPLKHHFPMRNRIIAALSSKLYIMAAELRSGTLATVDMALKLNKEIICLPHNINEKAGAGCNYLISDGASVLTII